MASTGAARTVSAGVVARADGAQELLGWWSIPIALLLAALLYVVLMKGLRSHHPVGTDRLAFFS